MKIIRDGNLDKLNKVVSFECNDCGCIFEANHNEYEIKSSFSIEYYCCECPCCGNRVLTYKGEIR